MVVLIIGILVAVAVPQYKKAVYKSRYATLKNLVKSMVVAQEVYYLANGQYATSFEELDIDIDGQLDGNKALYDWGDCHLYASTTSYNQQVVCSNNNIAMEYQQRLLHSPGNSNTRICIARTIDETDIRSQICQAETNRSTISGGGSSVGYLAYRYQD